MVASEFERPLVRGLPSDKKGEEKDDVAEEDEANENDDADDPDVFV